MHAVYCPLPHVTTLLSYLELNEYINYILAQNVSLLSKKVYVYC